MNLLTRLGRALLLTAALAAVCPQTLRAQKDTAWDCGAATNVGGQKSVIAKLSGNTLTISGEGDMGPQPHGLAGGAPWYGLRHLIDRVVIDPGVTSIGDNSFYGHIMMESVSIPKGMVSIGNSAFFGCTRYQEIYIPYGVKSIGVSAFYQNTGLAYVEIPNSVTTVGGNAFYGCTGLKTVDISARLDSLGNNMFTGCTGLTHVEIPDGVKSIGMQAFSGCSGLMSVYIPESVKSIGGGAFVNCTALTWIDIPSGVMAIQALTFMGCASLTSINIPDGVTAIPNGAFQGCASLAKVIIPQSVSSIANMVFEGCAALKSITIPSRVISIGTGVFGAGLTSVICQNPVPPKISSNTFLNTTNNVCLYVPRNSIRDYETAGYWKNFGCIKELKDTSEIVSIAAKDRAVPAAVSDGGAAAVPANRLTAEFAAGPNPVGVSRGTVSFFRYGSRIENAALSVYDASGYEVNTVRIEEHEGGGPPSAAAVWEKRAVGSWDLRDKRGRAVAEGTYLVRGAVKTSGGKTERVSLVVGVR